MRFVKIVTTLILLFALLPVQCFALSSGADNREIIYYSDGSYSTVHTEIIEVRASSTRIASKIYTYYDLLGNEVWSVTLNATFTYDGSTAKCTIANITIDITNSSWYTVSRSATRDGNTGSCTVVMGYKVLGITTDKKTANISITCDKNGNIS